MPLTKSGLMVEPQERLRQPCRAFFEAHLRPFRQDVDGVETSDFDAPCCVDLATQDFLPRGHRALCLLELVLHALKMSEQRTVPGRGIGRSEDETDLLEGHVQVAEATDRRRHRDLAGRVQRRYPVDGSISAGWSRPTS